MQVPKPKDDVAKIEPIKGVAPDSMFSQSPTNDMEFHR